jgi:hypothetical protein
MEVGMHKTKEAKKRVTAPDVTAADVILIAAKRSGLSEEIAEVLCFFYNDMDPSKMVGSVVGELITRLTEAFDDHLGLATGVLCSFTGEDFPDSPYAPEKLAPYLGPVDPDV